MADLIAFAAPPAAWEKTVPLSKRAQYVLFNALDSKSRGRYKSYEKNWEDFCYSFGKQPYPATPQMLVEWIAVQATGDIGFGRIKADTILQGISAI